jgi:hypothetical protein
VSMLEEVWSSGVTGRNVCRPPNCDPKDNDGRRERRGVGSLGLVLTLTESKCYYLESRLKFADKSAVNEAMGLRRSLLVRVPMSK